MSFFYHFDGSDIHRYSFRDFFLHFPLDPYGIRGFQLNVGRYDHFIFVIFVWILWDCRAFAVGMKTGCVGRFFMQTLFYMLTSKRKHLTLPKNAIKENGFIFASLTSLFFSFFYVSVIQIASFTNRKSQSPLTKIGDKKPLIFRFYPSFFTVFKNPTKHLRHSNT